MGVNKMLDDWERRLDSQYQKAKAAIQVLRATNLADETALKTIPAGILPSMAVPGESELDAACDKIINRSGHGYYRLSEVISKLHDEGVGLTENAQKFKNTVRASLNRLVKRGAIKKKPRGGRAGTIYLPKRAESTKNEAQ